MSERNENGSRVELRPLPSPRVSKARWPLSRAAAARIRDTRHAIRDLLHGRDEKRLLVVVGPCSIHDPQAALAYARRLGRVADATREQLVVVMRTYVEKPRTALGWKGLVNDPDLDGSCDVARGIDLARRLLVAINELGLPCASELLDPLTPQYLADLLSWSAVGARTAGSQTHRELASALPLPVGFKNGTDGGIEVARDAMTTARHPHSFPGVTAEGRTSVVKTRGNPDAHLVLRGGGGWPNHGPAAVARAAALVASLGVARPLLVDCSHGNSHKDHTRQAGVCREVLDQVRAGERRILGLLLESHLESGQQPWSPGRPLAYGVSITDACMSWSETEPLLYEIAEAAARGC